MLVTDAEAPLKLVDTLIELASDKERLETMSREIRKLALPGADEKIVDIIEETIKKK